MSCVEATISENDVLKNIHVGSQIGNCVGEVKELKDDGTLRVVVKPSGKQCSHGPCPLSPFCSATMEGYL